MTGGAGFLGAHLVRALLQRGHQVAAFDNLDTGTWKNLPEGHPGLVTIQGDLMDAPGVLAAVRRSAPDAVVHVAALVGAAAGAHRPALAVRVNVEGTVNLLEAMVEAGVQRGVLVSTEEVYGHFRRDPVPEDHPLEPTSPYGITKAAAEHFWRHYTARFGLDLVSVRTSWVYGAGYPRDRFDVRVITDALQGRVTRLESGADQRLDFTHVCDFVDGVLRVLEAGHLPHDAYNISGGQAYTTPQVVDIIREFLPGARVELGPGLLPYLPGQRLPQKGALDLTRAARDLGYRPQVDLRRGMAAYIEDLRRSLAGAGGASPS